MKISTNTITAPATGYFDLDCTGMGVATFEIAGTWDGEVQFQGSYDGTNFHQIYGMNEFFADGQLYPNNATDFGSGVPTFLKFDVSAVSTLRANIIGAGSTGTSTLTLRTDQGQGIVTGSISPISIVGSVATTTDGLTNTQLRASAVPVTAVLTTGSAVIGHVINDASSAVIGHVIADSGSTTAVTGNVASTVADGANVTLGAKADAKSTATDTTAISIMQVLKQISASAQAPPSQAVTNTGTFATQSTLAAETTKVIGTVNIASAQTVGIAAGSAVIGHVIVDTAPSTAVTNVGTFATQATLATETTKVIGTVNIAASQVVGLSTGSNTIGSLTANQSVNNAQVAGNTIVASVTGVQDVMPRKRTGSTGLSPIYSANHITSKTTVTPTASTAYISNIVISCTGAGTAWTIKIQDKSGTPLILIPAFTLAVPTTGLPVIISFTEPVIMTSGIDIITAGTTAGTVDVWITYWQ